MTKVQNYKYHSTNQFRNVVKTIVDRAKFKGVDDEGHAIIDHNADLPTLKYIGTVKLHGTNASIVIHEDGVVSFHSKSQLLGYIKDDEFTLNRDNAEFAQLMYARKEGVYEVVRQAKRLAMEVGMGEIKYPIKVSGEWVGPSIHKGVGISFLNKKSLFVFGVKIGDDWLPVQDTVSVKSQDFNIFNICDYGVKEIDINFAKPEHSLNTLVDYVNEVENQCPVAKSFGIEECTVGEGLVWTPADPDLVKDSGTWYKTKGQKHSVSKVKTVVAVSPEKLESIDKFVEYAATEQRLEQGLSEVGLDQKSIGAFIGWVNRDILKEESDVLEANHLTMKDVGKDVSTISRKWYLNKLNNF